MGAALACVVAAWPGTALAQRPYEHARFHDVITFPGEECGIPVENELTLSVHLLLREVRGSDGQAYLGKENIHARQVVTNPANDRWLVLERAGTSKEVKATHVEGNVWAFHLQETGVFKLIDSDGKLVLQDRGRLTRTGYFDTLGDGRPGGTLLYEEFTGMHGKFPLFDEDIACEAITELIG
jgi:hypothetical protein